MTMIERPLLRANAAQFPPDSRGRCDAVDGGRLSPLEAAHRGVEGVAAPHSPYEGSTESFATYLNQQLNARKKEGKFTTFCNAIERKLDKFSDEKIIPLIVLNRGTSEEMLSKLTPSAVRHLEKLADSMPSDRFISEALVARKNSLAVRLAVRKTAIALKLLSKDTNSLTHLGLDVVDQIAIAIVQVPRSPPLTAAAALLACSPARLLASSPLASPPLTSSSSPLLLSLSSGSLASTSCPCTSGTSTWSTP